MRKHNIPESVLEKFDEVTLDIPERGMTARMIVLPLKTVFINTGAEPFANIDRVFYDIEDFEDFLPECMR